MGTYNNSKQEIKDKIEESLDAIEGDFDRATLKKALSELGNEYKHVI